MRLLQVSHTAESGGSNAVLLSLIRHAPAGTANACVFLEGGPVLERVAELGVGAKLVPSGRAREIWRFPSVIRQLRAAIRAHEPDIVLSHVNKAHLYGGPAARLEGVPTVWWQHEHWQLKRLLQFAASRVHSEAIVCSAGWIAAEQRRHSRVPVHVVNAGIETGFLAAPARRHTAGAEDGITIGVVGRLARWKRVELAIDALPVIRRSLPGARLRIIGGPGTQADAGYDAELAARAERLGVRTAVELTGAVDSVEAELARLDLLLHPAEQEPWGLALLEAMAAGIPVVAVDEAGPREIVRDGVDGALVHEPNPDAFAAAAVRLGRDPELRNEMGAAGRQRVSSRFTAERSAAALWELLRQVLAVA